MRVAHAQVLVLADALQILCQRFGERTRAGDLVVLTFGCTVADRFVHCLRNFGKDVRIVQALQHCVYHLFTGIRLNGAIGRRPFLLSSRIAGVSSAGKRQEYEYIVPNVS